MSARRNLSMPRPLGTNAAAVLAIKAALSAIVQRRNGAHEPVRVLYYRAHSLLRTLRQHLGAGPAAAA